MERQPYFRKRPEEQTASEFGTANIDKTDQQWIYWY